MDKKLDKIYTGFLANLHISGLHLSYKYEVNTYIRRERGSMRRNEYNSPIQKLSIWSQAARLNQFQNGFCGWRLKSYL